MSFFDKLKQASKGVVDAGAKTMLKTDIVFIDREIKARKQKFGIEIYDLMVELESNTGMTTDEKEAKIRASFDAARKDIAIYQAKKDVKYEEMQVLEADKKTDTEEEFSIPPSAGTVVQNMHPSETMSP